MNPILSLRRSELLILIIVFAILIGLLVPGVEPIRDTGARYQSSNNLKQMSLALATMSECFCGKLPAGYATFPGTFAVAGDPYTEAQSFFFWILPFIEQDVAFKNRAFDACINTYCAPQDSTNPGNTSANSYSVNGRVFGGCTGRGPVVNYPDIFHDKGTSNTVAFFERYARLNGSWPGAPADNADGSCVLYGPHTDIGGAVKDPTFGLPDTDPSCTLTANGYTPMSFQVALADGSARSVGPGITAWPSPSMGTSIWGWAISITGPADGQFAKAPPPAEW
jgi:hypothetical protein